MNGINSTQFLPVKSKAKVSKAIQENILFREFSQVAINNFEYGNLPNELESRRFERVLFYNGLGAFFYDDKYGYVVLPATAQTGLDYYYEPTKWHTQGYGLNKSLNDTNSVLIRNNLYGIPTVQDTLYYVTKIVEVQRVIDTQLQLLKTPYIVKSTDKQVLTMKNILSKKEDGEVAIFVSNDINPEAFTIFPTPTDYTIDKLYDYKRKLINEYYALFGYNNNPEEKKERLIVDEVNANNEQTENGYVGVMYQMRKEAVDKINEMYGLNITVEVKRQRLKTPEFYEVLENEPKTEDGNTEEDGNGGTE